MSHALPKRQLELQQLVDLACDGLLGEAERLRLNEILASDPAAVEFYVNYLRMEGMIAWDFGQLKHHSDGPAKVALADAKRASFFTQWPMIAALAMVVFVGGAIAYFAWPQPNRGTIAAGNPAEVMAQLTGVYGAKWADESSIAFKSQLVAGQKLELRDGVAEITFAGGAVVMLEGPATLDVVDEGNGFLHAGKLTAQVPPRAHGFRIDTPLAPIVDLGTQFGVIVRDGQALEVQVFRGRIIVEASSSLPQPMEVTAGSSLQLEQGSPAVVEPITDPSQFALWRNFATPSHWLDRQRELLADPAMAAYYSFEQDPQRPARLANLSAAGERLDGTVTNAHWASGRWADKGALSFGGPASKAHVDLGENSARDLNFAGSFSVAVWFRIVGDGGGDFPALITKGDYAWRLHVEAHQGVLAFGTTPTVPTDLFGTKRIVDGRWHLGVAVYEVAGKTGVKKLYVDGQLEATQATSVPIAATESPVFVGENSQHPGREFYGLIDEVAILRRALNDAEVEAMYEAGKPIAPPDDSSNEANRGVAP